ncbi:MAG: S1 RNA-binding domain-containing protein [Ruminococcus albus]|jgi:S1 RNA binding domain protein|uniref:S1 RNA-binding domain-containing protein n=1 Tax=Ruminococcus sp. TaxID=41978 RepID=UPI0025D21CE5|nr:S1 RNA-binding domain-containing protein [Ruminococcus sp.]MBE6874688.1 S1 RNA-binding domain-containing protein [Ruminococcus albus]MBQ9542867.1 S1 RNA-binding domain-containing protein [Ruminococcus sp.]MBR0529168.1 S1 RNA-binding domain-containing protein [Ruminococcus sp.]
MQLEVGKIYEGKVTGITKFGAFVELDKDTTGMVHISEVANTFVNEIKDHLQEGQTVKVKVLSLGEDGKISLSIKKAQPAPQRRPAERGGRPNGGAPRGDRGDRNDKRQGGRPQQGSFRPRRDDRPPQDFSKNPPPIYDPNQNSGNADFEDMLSKFKASSDEKFSDLKKITDNKRRSPSRRK